MKSLGFAFLSMYGSKDFNAFCYFLKNFVILYFLIMCSLYSIQKKNIN